MSNNTSKYHKQNVAEYFNKCTLFWGIVYGDDNEKVGYYYNYFMKKRNETTIKIIDIYSNGHPIRILDAGCGAGVLMARLGERGNNVVGVDLSKNMAKEARNKLINYTRNNIKLFNSDVENLPFKNESFDAVVSLGVLQYLQQDRKCLEEYSRVVKNGGVIIVSFPNMLRINNILDPYYYLVRGISYLIYLFKKNVGILSTPKPKYLSSNETFNNRRYIYNEWEKNLDNINLINESVHSVGYGPFTFWQKEFISKEMSIKISNFLDQLSYKCGFMWLKYFANRWVVCIRKK